ncbi:MAG: hypothetical protein WA435_14885 [Gallionellaceae bacterium]
MHTPHPSRLLVGVILVVAMPSIACFGWYSLGSTPNASAFVRAMVVAAYPAAIISLALLVLALSSPKPSRRRVWVSALCLALTLAIVFVARSGILPT